MQNEATFIRDLPANEGDTRKLWKLSKPVEFEDGRTVYVITEAVCSEWGGRTSILPADSAGEVIKWQNLYGSYSGGADHERAFRYAGWASNGQPMECP